jgi:methionyl-tRNA synthetase
MRKGLAMADEKPTIAFDEFVKLDLRVGTVTEVADHPNADKLLVLDVNLGDERRRLVAGLKGHYTPEELTGKRVVVVTNLEPATLRGVESRGMLLACQDGDRVVILTPERDAAPGSPVL